MTLNSLRIFSTLHKLKFNCRYFARGAFITSRILLRFFILYRLCEKLQAYHIDDNNCKKLNAIIFINWSIFQLGQVDVAVCDYFVVCLCKIYLLFSHRCQIFVASNVIGQHAQIIQQNVCPFCKRSLRFNKNLVLIARERNARSAENVEVFESVQIKGQSNPSPTQEVLLQRLQQGKLCFESLIN